MMPKDNLHTVTNSLTGTHLGLALEAFYHLKEPKTKSKGAISVILHSYCGLESALNAIGYEMFNNSNSQQYIPKKDRDFLLNRFIESWKRNVQCLDKLEFITLHNNHTFPDKLKNKLTELNNLRNWLAHGFSYSTTFLLEETDKENNYKVIDYEDNVNWKKNFPRCKFNPITRLNIDDAEKALRIILETLIELSKINMHYIFSLSYHYNGPQYRIIARDTDIEDLFKSP